MKTIQPLRRKTARILAGAIAALLTTQVVQAVTLYWDPKWRHNVTAVRPGYRNLGHGLPLVHLLER